MNSIGNIEKYILDFAAYSEEPLHIIISAVSEEANLTPKRTVTVILTLFNKGYLKCYRHSGKSGDPYEETTVNKNILLDYIERNQGNAFSEYPAGEEYFFQTSDKGWELLNSEENE